VDLPSNASALIEDLAIRMYSEPASSLWADRLVAPMPLRIMLLILDFDTEVSMNGVLGYLENSTGRYLTEAETAFALVGATRTADILRSVSAALDRLGTSPTSLNTDLQKVAQYEVTTFRTSHGIVGEAVAEAVAPFASSLYMHRPPSERDEHPLDLLERYVEDNFEQILAQVAVLYDEQGGDPTGHSVG
jgi:hypothetical protein